MKGPRHPPFCRSFSAELQGGAARPGSDPALSFLNGMQDATAAAAAARGRKAKQGKAGDPADPSKPRTQLSGADREGTTQALPATPVGKAPEFTFWSPQPETFS